MNEVVIGEHNYYSYQQDITVDGELKSRGGIPRDWNTYPRGCYSNVHAVDIPLIPSSQFAERIRDKVAAKSQLSNLRMDRLGGPAFSSLDQDGVGYCWGHSSTHANMYLRLVQNQPVIPLSAFSVCATIKKGADQGGWGAQSLDFMTERGVMAQSVWPQGDRNYRNYDKPENWVNAGLHKVTEGWIDLNEPQYDRKLTYDQVITLVLVGIPVVVDYNWWSHSVLGIDAVDGNSMWGIYREGGKLPDLPRFRLVWGIDDPVTGGINLRIQNSWGDGWSENGLGVLTGSKAVPDGAVAPRVSMPSVA